jgi:hypothetical protein
MVQISVTQALTELKLLDKRIRAYTDAQCDWIEVSTKTKVVDVPRFEAKVKSEYQSLFDLIKRRDVIKRAVVLSNATTKVKVGTWEGTVAEAIELMISIQYKENLLTRLKEALSKARAQVAAEELNLQSRLDRLLASELGKDVKTHPETIQAITKSFQENNKVTLVDPLNLETKIKDLEAEVESFDANVDWVLSESNGRTLIDV